MSKDPLKPEEKERLAINTFMIEKIHGLVFDLFKLNNLITNETVNPFLQHPKLREFLKRFLIDTLTEFGVKDIVTMTNIDDFIDQVIKRNFKANGELKTYEEENSTKLAIAVQDTIRTFLTLGLSVDKLDVDKLFEQMGSRGRLSPEDLETTRSHFISLRTSLSLLSPEEIELFKQNKLNLVG